MSDSIQHVSDTALWVAHYRSVESERRDALFHDPLARKLVGEKGRKIAADMPLPGIMSFVMVVRTTAIDRLIFDAIAQGVDTVINLGAGLDTRPYRMELPHSLRWIEVDFQHMIDFKNETLRGDKPECRLERIACDLSLDEDRQALLNKIGSESAKILVVTEGLIPYLSNEQGAQLSMDLHAVASIKYWIQDYTRGNFRKDRGKRFEKKMRSAPFLFDVAEPFPFFQAHGWRVAEDISMMDEARRVGRRMRLPFPWNILSRIMPKSVRSRADRSYGYVLFERG